MKRECISLFIFSRIHLGPPWFVYALIIKYPEVDFTYYFDSVGLD